MIPSFDLPVYHIGPVPLDPWGILVTVGFMVGLEVARARGLKLGLDVADVVDGCVFTVLSGFVGGHVINVLAYHPEQLAENPFLALARIWAGFSSFGGFIGAIFGITFFFRRIRKVPFWPHADSIMFGFPFGWIFGRLGCFSVHDHIGRLTTFPLAVDFAAGRFFKGDPGGARFDLGLVEALWTMGIAVAFALLARKPRPDRFFPMVWCFMYAPARFCFDFLRNTDIVGRADVRWSGLTPAQWGCILMFGAGIWLWRKIKAAA